MSQDTAYVTIPYIYKSRGLNARPIEDQAPEYVYIQLMNILEREENAVSSRFGTQIINRDPLGTGTANHYFSAPVTSLSRLNYQSNAWRYAGLGNGSLQRRAGNGQGAYTQLALPTTWTQAPILLSGQPFGSLVDNCFETSQPYLFIYDQNASIKDSGTGNPQLTGIDPSPITLNVLPYAPLLIMIDSFATANTYSVVNVTGWAWGNIETLDANSGALITDFSQFYGIGPSGGGTTNYSPSTTSLTVTATQSGSGTTTNNSSAAAGFASVVPSFGETVSLTVTWNSAISVFGPAGTGAANIQYSPDGGVTWYNMAGVSSSAALTTPSISSSASIGVSNLNLLQIRAQGIGIVSGPGGTVTATTNITNIYASISNPNAFGPVTSGMLALLSTNASKNVPISSVVSQTLSGGLYTQLLVTTTAAHGLVANDLMAIYASSSDLVDGFYQVIAAPTTTTLTVAFISASQIGAAGGYVTYTTTGSADADSPAACVLTDQYSSPYPSQMSAWGFNEWVPPTIAAFPISAWAGTVAASTTGTVSKTVTLDLNQNNQVTDDDLIVMTLLTSAPSNIEQVQLQFWVGSSSVGSPSNYYSAFIAPAYYQSALNGSTLAYSATQSQILADTLNLITGQPPGTTSAQLQPSNISTGPGSWQACYIPRGNFLPVGQAGQAGLDWASVTGWTLTVTTNANAGGASFSVNGLYLQWGYGPSSFAGIGYDWRQTYYNANTGTESNPTPIQTFNEDYGYLASTSAPIFLRQAAQIVGQYSNDPQTTHVRIYRRGGTLSSNWVQVIQAPNVTAGGQFTLKDVIADAFVEQAQILVLDNDPPVTSSLVNPIQTTLSAPTAAPGSSIYSTFFPQVVNVAQAGAVFVPNQIVIVGNASNLEETSVVMGGTGMFTAILRLQHNQGEPVNVYAVPRQPCNLCAMAYDQVWLAGDPNNPHYLYYSKKGLPENFGPQNYIPVSTPDDPINAVINWRGTLIVGTLKTWFIIVGGAQPYAQPTGSTHGIIAQQAWVEVEGAIWYRAADGLREFTGADGVYKSLPIEWIYRGNPQCLPPQADPTQATQDVMAYYNNQVLTSYISLNNSGQRYRNVWDTEYQRFRQDDVATTAMLWEKDTNTLLVGKQIAPTAYAVVQDQIGDYDDGGWTNAQYFAPVTVTTGAWTNPTNATSFSQYAVVSTETSGNHLTCATGALSIPVGATILGIGVSFAAYNFGGSTVSCSLISTLGTSSPQATAALTGTLASYTLGGGSFLWGQALTPAVLNAGFTMFIVSQYIAFGFGATSLNNLVVTIYYSTAGTPALIQTPINLTIQTPYNDLKKPHQTKNWNGLETDVNTQNQVLNTTLLFEDGAISLALSGINTGTTRQKAESIVNLGEGQEAYRASILHTMAVTVAPTLYQEAIDAALLPPNMASWDTYDIKFGTDDSKFAKESYWDYTSPVPVNVSLYADNSYPIPYFTFQLPARPNRGVIRVRHGNVNSGTTAFTFRTWRAIALAVTATDPLQTFQFWANPKVLWKPVGAGHTFQMKELEV